MENGHPIDGTCSNGSHNLDAIQNSIQDTAPMVNHRLNLNYTPQIHDANILLVDDRQENLLALEAMLENIGATLVRAHSGEEALKWLLRMDFAVILLDVQMPTMDGFETATLIRERERSRHTPIIFLTAISRTEEHVFQGYAIGAVDYLFKPLNPHILRAKVAAFIELYLKNQEIQRQAYAIEQANTELAEQLREVKRLNRELETVNRELETFSYSVSHDLRAPLRRISGFSQALLEDYYEKVDEEGQMYLSRIMALCGEMGQLIDDLLELSRVTRAKIYRIDVNLTEMAQEIIDTQRNAEPERNVEIRIYNNMKADGDQRLLHILMENLLSNAWKFTRRRDSTYIEVGHMMQNDMHVYYVRDNGAGFSMEHATNLFGPFHRLHNDAEFEGTGIGLATAQRIIHRHGGKIWAEAAPEQGATFYFTL